MIRGFSSYAVKVDDLEAAAAFHVDRLGATPHVIGTVFGCRYTSVELGSIKIYFFDKAPYEDAIGKVLPLGFLHVVFEVDHFEPHVDALRRAGVIFLMEPQLVTAAFGARKIAFFEAPGGFRMEIMEIVPAS
jgi:catechol 2,3-dioxygenase-like lactoylglutathione lyase family enzyme